MTEIPGIFELLGGKRTFAWEFRTASVRYEKNIEEMAEE